MRPNALLSLLLCFLLSASFSSIRAAEPDWQVRPQWDAVFSQAKVRGTMLVFDDQAGQMRVHDPARARREFIPASTFKLFNALVALEEKVVTDEYEVLHWDGQKRWLEVWNRDHSLASGMKFSTLWLYQDVARRAGQARMQHWLTASHYGNAEMGNAVDRFWLDGTLRISAEQQIAFLRKLADGQLPFSASTQETVRRIALIDDGVGYRLHGKTGWSGEGAGINGAALGWFVGWAERGEKRWFFAINIDIHEDADGEKRKSLARKILALEGALPATPLP